MRNDVDRVVVAEVFLLGVKNLMRNKLRSFLTMLGMIFGVGSVIAMLSVGAGARQEILSRIQELGIKNIIVNSIRPPEETKADSNESWVDRYGLTFRDKRDDRRTYARVWIGSCRSIWSSAWLGTARKRLDSSVLGVKPDHLSMFGLDVSRGRTVQPDRFCHREQGLHRAPRPRAPARD